MKYEYAMQWRLTDKDDWVTCGMSHPTLCNAENSRDWLLRSFPKAITRIVRRPVNEWEVVK